MDLKRFDDYKKEVILAYKKKKNEGSLPSNLRDHTPANLKKECMDEFPGRYLDKDSETFKSLFGKGNNAEEYFQKIKASDPDIFRPLNTFLKKNTESGTHNRNIELLAWLINFEFRPHRPVDFYTKSEPEREKIIPKEPAPVAEPDVLAREPETEELKETDIINESDEKIIIEEEVHGVSVITSDDTQNVNNKIINIPRKFNKTIISFFGASIILICSYILYDKSKHQCMYWNNDHYQSIACDQKVNGAIIIAADTSRLEHLKKITNLSKITINDIGKVYYSKVYNKVEFYTTGGENPTDNRKRLLPMTKYMYEKYILHK